MPKNIKEDLKEVKSKELTEKKGKATETKKTVTKKNTTVKKTETKRSNIKDKENVIIKDSKNTVKNKTVIEKNNKNTIKDKKENVKDNKNTIKEKKEVIKDNKNTIKEKKEVIKDNKNTVKDKKEVIKDSKNVVKDKKEISKDSKNVIKDKKETTKNKDTVKEKKEVIKDSKNTVKDEKGVAKNSKNTIKDKKEITKEAKQPEFLQEYYDLPYRYNETIVTILAQTPKRIFVYWDISDKDIEKYRKAFGDDFFEKTYPVLLIHNQELNYTFEVPINDFANSWYLDVKDSKTNYVVQLGRKFKNINQAKVVNYDVIKEENINLQNDFIYITDSNKLESPNDHILFELLSSKIKYRNVKNGNEFTKNLKDLVKDLNNIYPEEIIHELYTKLYADELSKEDFGRKNPGSEEFGLPTSSGSFGGSSQFTGFGF